tara:strand:- start:7783 stop:9138 length:1356 start_codon:yes stop_codon:yes gene_type:complete
MKILITEIQLKQLLTEAATIAPPLKRISVNSPYSKRRCLKGQKCRPHNGVDLKASSGTKIYSPENGVVKRAKCKKGACGGDLKIEHDNGIVTRYCHVKQFFVNKGERVGKGQAVGLVGGAKSDPCKGNSLGAHLHYEVYINGKPVDPAPYLKGTFQAVDGEPLPPLDDDTLMLWDGMDRGREDKKSDVRKMQTLLVQRNYILPRFGIDGRFGQETQAAVNAFQKDYGLEVSGLVDDEMLKKLKDPQNINKNPQINDPILVKQNIKKGDTKSWSPKVIDAIEKASEKYGVDYNLMLTIANIESGGNPQAQNKRSGASGLYQIMPKYFFSYGVDKNTVWDPYANANAAAQKLSEKISNLRSELGRPPTNAEIYMVHNQGSRGFRVIYNACKKFGGQTGKKSLQSSATDLGYSKKQGTRIFKNMKGNKGNHPCEFMESWARIYSSRQITPDTFA